MPTVKREEEDATANATHRRSPADLTPNVTEAKPPASATAPTMPVKETPRNAEDEIRRRAYELYEQDGRQHGRDREHWLRAEAEILGHSNNPRASAAQSNAARTKVARASALPGQKSA